MRKLGIAVVAILLLLVTGLVAGPAVVDWKRFAPQIADAVRDATGRELRIDGDIDINLVPAITFGARDVHLSNPSSFALPEMASIASIEGRMPLWPLVTGRLVVERLVVQGLDVALEVDESGRPNWLFEPAAEPEEPDDEDGELPIADLALDDVRIVDGVVGYRNALTGQELNGRDLNLEVSLEGLNRPLDLRGAWILNEQPVALVTSVVPFEAVLTGEPARIALSLDTAHLDARLDADVQTEPLFGLDGRASIDVPSVGELAAWLGVPYDTDPGPLRLRARFDADGPRIALEEAVIEGDQLLASATASVEIGDDGTRIVAKVESGVVDIDRYLPPASAGPAPRPAAVDDGASYDPFDIVPDMALDLASLRRLLTDVDVRIEGIRFAGQAVSPIRFTATAADGVLAADLDEIGLFGGIIGGSLRLDATTDTLAARANLIVANVDAGALAEVGAGDPPPVVGLASGRALVRTNGRTLRELTRNITGEIDASLSSAGGPKIAGQLTELSLAVDRPSPDASAHLRGSAVYGGEAFSFDLQTDRPIETLLVGDTIAAAFVIESDVLTARYDGRVVPGPAPSLDGEFEARIPSVARLLDWAGRPLPEEQSDPGGLRVHARLESDGTVAAIQQATIEGEGLDLDAAGSFDASGEVLEFDLVVEGGVLDIDRYLPSGGVEAADGDGGNQIGDDPLAALSDQRFDLAALHGQEGRVAMQLDGLRIGGIELGAIGLEGTLDDGRIDLDLDRLAVAEGTLTAQLKVDGAGEPLAVEGSARAVDIRAARLEALLKGSGISLDGRASAQLTLSGEGGTPRQLATGTKGSAKLALPGVKLDQGPIARVGAIDVTVDLAGVEAGPEIDATTSLYPRDDGAVLPVDLRAQLGPLPELLAGTEVPLDLVAEIGTMTLQVAGEVADLDGVPRPDVEIRIEGERLKDLEGLTGSDLPDIAPYSIGGRVTTENGLHRIAGLAARLGRSDLVGEITVDLGGARPRVTADLRSELLDVAELTGAETNDDGATDEAIGEEMETDDAAAREEVAAAPADEGAEAAPRLIPDDPLPTEQLRALDAEITLAARNVLTHLGKNVDDLEARIELSDGDLHLAQSGKTAGGGFELKLELDNGDAVTDMEAAFNAKDLLMETFTDLLRQSGESVGTLDVNIHLNGRGNTPRAIAASLDGQTRIVGQGGSVDSTIMRVLSVGLGSLFRAFGDGRERNYLNCFVLDFGFEDGIGTAKHLLVDFPALSIAGTGTIDLREEQLDLQLNPGSKNASFMSLAVPFDVTGPLSAPRIRPDAVGTGLQVLRGAGLAALLLNPISGIAMTSAQAATAVLGGDVVRAGRRNPCIAALQQAEATGEVRPDSSWFRRLRSVYGTD